MSLKKSVGNMYGFISHTWNPVKGKCSHECAYCYMTRFGEQKPLRLDEAEMKTNLGSGNMIFVGSGCDLWANDVPIEWIMAVLDYCYDFDNTYFWQTKNTYWLFQYSLYLPEKSIVCTTIESNREYPEFGKAPISPFWRAIWFARIKFEKHVTIEPIMDFDLDEMVDLIKMCRPKQVNIGANTNHKIKLPEPSSDKIYALIERLEDFTDVHLKPNLNRLLED